MKSFLYVCLIIELSSCTLNEDVPNNSKGNTATNNVTRTDEDDELVSLLYYFRDNPFEKKFEENAQYDEEKNRKKNEIKCTELNIVTSSDCINNNNSKNTGILKRKDPKLCEKSIVKEKKAFS
ncbi:hypothetical protein EDEG_01261 [Edhazardia aedis USNM 41457]|uniref:Lipoprotein n=1 Tax=Edhazardia aedis (strain USNM 41457) TaxID=1003232 RepID=J9DPN8_EDHAE|nr:hypothetical protein EDEG_01261 [Edhazardia aedis USNM 41457]|eukprot:EJW04520.1 hypothetical protein EDEG_01261 [Edhazardia aedis USNM 41457]